MSTSTSRFSNSSSQGVEGQLIRYEEGYDPVDEVQRLQGAKWRIDPSLGEPGSADEIIGD